jgi:hypothetical protein
MNCKHPRGDTSLTSTSSSAVLVPSPHFEQLDSGDEPDFSRRRDAEVSSSCAVEGIRGTIDAAAAFAPLPLLSQLRTRSRNRRQRHSRLDRWRDRDSIRRGWICTRHLRHWGRRLDEAEHPRRPHRVKGQPLRRAGFCQSPRCRNPPHVSEAARIRNQLPSQEIKPHRCSFCNAA